jgi:hypothetical protein
MRKKSTLLKNRPVENIFVDKQRENESKEDRESRRCFLSCVQFKIMFYFISESHTVDSMTTETA